MTDIIKKSDALDKKIEDSGEIQKSIDALVLAGRRNRRLIGWVIVSTVFEFILTIAVIFTVVLVSQNRAEIRQNRNTIVKICEGGNDFRNSEKALWTYILSIPPDTTPTPEQQKRINTFKVYLNKTFAPRDCSKL